MRHDLIDAVLKEIPDPGQPWRKEERARWLDVLKAVIELVYGNNEGKLQKKRDDDDSPLTRNQEFALQALRTASEQADHEGWFEQSLQQTAQNSGVPLGSISVVVDALAQKNLIEVGKSEVTGKRTYRMVESS